MDKTASYRHVFHALVKYSIPLLGANLLQSGYSIADMAIIGYFTDNVGLAAVSNASSLVLIIIAASIGLSIGGTVIAANYKGAANIKGQRDTISTLFLLSLFVSLLLIAICLLCHRKALLLMDIPTEALEDASSYMSIVALGTVFIFGYNAACAIMRGVGDSLRTFYFVAIAAGVNVALDILLVGGAGMGVKGAAWATVASQGFAFLIAFRHIWMRFGLEPGMLSFNSEQARRILAVGMPSAVQLVVINVSYLLITTMYNKLGIASAVAAGIGIKIATFSAMPTWAIGQAVIAMAGQSMGAGDPERAGQFAKAGLWLNIGIMTLMVIFIQAFATELILMFTPSSQEALAAGVLYLRIYCGVNSLAYAAKYTLDSFMTGTGAATLAMINALLDSIVMRIFLSWFFGFYMGYGFAGICIGQAVAPLPPLIIGILYFCRNRWRHRRLI